MRKSNNLLRDEKRLAKYCEEGNKSDDRKIQIKFISLCVNNDITLIFQINKHDKYEATQIRRRNLYDFIRFKILYLLLFDNSPYTADRQKRKCPKKKLGTDFSKAKNYSKRYLYTMQMYYL